MTEPRCENCANFEETNHRYAPEGVRVGVCSAEPFDVGTMREDYFTVVCGHDGPVIVGAKFGCIHFKENEEAED